MKSGEYYADKYKNSYMNSAEVFARNSVAGRLQVGCVIVLNDGMMMHGWNGMPSGSETEVCEDNEGRTKPCVIHAEDNAMRKINTSMEVFYTENSVAFVTHAPCTNCAEQLSSFGISTVYYLNDYKSKDGVEVLLDAGINVIKM